jgi:class 3 adenylate cyclase
MGASELVTLLFTDLVGSTELLARLGDDAAEAVRREHISQLRHAVANAGGREVKTLGDGVMVSFPSAVAALGCAVAMQESVADHNRAWPETRLGLRVGLHAGEPAADEDDLHGTAVVVAKRLCDAASAGQILASELVAELVGSRGGFRFRGLGPLALKGLPEPVRAVDLDWAGSDARSVPPPSPSPPAPRHRPVRPRTPLVGRRDELAVLLDERARATEEGFRCVLLTGDPGVGKSRLAAELLAEQPGDVLGLTARAYPLGATASLGLWVEALDRHLRALGAAHLRRLAGPYVDDLAAVLPSVALARGSAPAAEPPRARVLDGLGAVIERLAESQPVTVILDDVHLADASSWEALNHLSRHLAGVPLLVVLAARPVELAEERIGPEVLLGLEQEGVLRRLPLSALDSDGIRRLAESVLTRPVPDALVAWLMERSRGSPLFTLGLTRALKEEGADLDAPSLRSLPEDLAERVRVRLGRLDPGAQRVLELLAAVGRRVELGELAAFSDLTIDELADPLERLVRSRLVAEDERDHHLAYEVAHPLFQEAIYAGTGGVRRRLLHRRAARVLRDTGRLGEAALHFARSAEPGDGEAIDALLDALRQTDEREAYREAAAILAALGELLPAGDDRWLLVLDALSREAEWVVDHRVEAQVDAVIDAMRAVDSVLSGSTDLVRRGTVKLRLASLYSFGLSDAERAGRFGAEALDLLERAGDRHRALLARIELGLRNVLADRDMPGLLSSVRAVFEDAERLGDEPVVMQAAGWTGLAASWSGQFAEAEAAFARSNEIAARAGSPFRSLWNAAFESVALAFAGRVPDAVAMIATAKESHPGYRESLLLEWSTLVHLLHGDYKAVLDACQEIISWHPGALGNRRGLALGFGARAAVETADVDLARRYVAMTREIYRREFVWYGSLADWAEAALVAESDPDGALLELRRVSEWITPPTWATPVLADLAEFAALAGQPAVAAEAAARLATIAADVDTELQEAHAALAGAWAALCAGEPDPAAASRAAEVFSRLEYRGYAGRALHLRGLSLAATDRAGAGAAFRQAAEFFERCGATARRARAEAAPAGGVRS